MNDDSFSIHRLGSPYRQAERIARDLQEQNQRNIANAERLMRAMQARNQGEAEDESTPQVWRAGKKNKANKTPRKRLAEILAALTLIAASICLVF